MKKKTESEAPVIPVKKSGRTTAYLITGDRVLNLTSGDSEYKPMQKSSQKVIKDSTQKDDLDFNYDIIPPPLTGLACMRFYDQHPYFRWGINFKSACVALLGGSFKPIDPTMTDFTNDPEYIKCEKLRKRPNLERDSWNNLLHNLCIEYYLYGNGYLEAVMNKANKEIAELYNLRAWNTYAKLFYKKLYYIQRSAQGDIWFTPYYLENKNNYSLIVPFKKYHLRNKYYGAATWYSATAELVLSRSITEYRIRKFDNNLTIQFIIICEGGDIDEGGLKMIQDYLASNFKGLSNTGKVLYLNTNVPDAKIRVEKVTAKERELDFVNSQDQIRDFILASLDIPAAILGIKTVGQLGATTEIKDLLNIFNETVIKPDKNSLADIINDVLATLHGITKFRWEFTELTIDKLVELVDMVSKMVSLNVIDTNEGREVLGWKPKESEPTDILKRVANISAQIAEIKKSLVA